MLGVGGISKSKQKITPRKLHQSGGSRQMTCKGHLLCCRAAFRTTVHRNGTAPSRTRSSCSWSARHSGNSRRPDATRWYVVRFGIWGEREESHEWSCDQCDAVKAASNRGKARGFGKADFSSDSCDQRRQRQ
ncbi:hypothetical protein DOTSEDRAFT_71647 [Dothistroma septosporum NZE10]|uniref:Uncharacterized protein n=1 Tax=Dothistroma septosporum (strain NZE10 / CBS 128990) TaxID=675120 RepID=N1PNE3_DOTSN|nr:hypothetical protein DOTSEDRAFT_71647 [Dothistroma septosporum NZE10]